MSVHELKQKYGQSIALIRKGLGVTRSELSEFFSMPVEVLSALERGDIVQDRDWAQFYKEIREEEAPTMTQEERDCLDGDMFAYISESVSRYIAEICGKLGAGRCTCSAISDIVRKKNGHPLMGDLKRIREKELTQDQRDNAHHWREVCDK